MEKPEFEKSKIFSIGQILEYVPNSVVIKTISQKTTGYISAVAADSGEILTGKPTPFDTFIQVIDGEAEVIINGESHLVEIGQAIIIPAHCRNTIKAKTKFKMLSTVIKSGYED